MEDEPVNLTIRVLREIRDEVRKTNERLDATGAHLDARIDGLGAGIGGLGARIDGLGARIIESELRTATALTDLATNVREMTAVLRAQHDLRPRLERCERDIEDLRARLPG
jgi:hypothetical protein